MIEAETIADVALASAPERVEGPWREFWHAYAQSRGALLGLALTVALVLLAIFAGVVAPHPPYEQYREFTLTPPAWQPGGSSEFILGTDPVGRDVRGGAARSGPAGAAGGAPGTSTRVPVACRPPSQDAWLTEDMLKSPTRTAGIAVRVK